MLTFTKVRIRANRKPSALKVWMMLKHHGVERFGRLIDQNITQARYLTDLIEADPVLKLMAPTATSVVCFRFDPGDPDEGLRLQEAGLAVPSETTLRGRLCLRAAFCNHRTRRSDIDAFAAAVTQLGYEILGFSAAAALSV